MQLNAVAIVAGRVVVLVVLCDCDTFLKTRARFEIEHLLQTTVADQLLDRDLAMLLLRLGQEQLGRVAIIKTAKSSLVRSNSYARSSVTQQP